MDWKNTRQVALNNCVGALFVIMTWHFLLNKNWATSIVVAAFYAVAMTAMQALIVRSKSRKRDTLNGANDR